GKADPGAGPETSLTTDPVAKAGAVNLAARSTSIYSPTFSTKSAKVGHSGTEPIQKILIHSGGTP
ncbi:MAG: hypothetical protein Q7V40_21220, partial [Pseudolabrys sp.]|nr:hypothetical protein [Pseudolabrys sp.]